MKCPECQFENREGVRFCEECGARLELTCSACGATIPPGRKFCGECGMPLSIPAATAGPTHEAAKSLAQAGTATDDRSDAERRQLTVMFCDLVGSTALSGQLDPEDMRDVNRAYQDACTGAIKRFEGYVARYMGDGILAYFGYPQAHEDDAERAVRAGLGIVEAMTGLNATFGQDKGAKLAVRVGIATGQVVVGDLIGEGASQESAVVGETPNLAARLQGLADPDMVVIGPGTHGLAAGRFQCEDLGIRELKGITKPVQAWRVLGERVAETRFEATAERGLTPLVGREEEISLLLSRWQRAKEGEGQVVWLSGEAGIGKSRIIQTLRERLADEPHTRLRYQCSPYYTSSALFPIVSQLERAAQFAQDDSPERKLDKLEALLAQSTSAVEEVAPLFGALLSIPPGDRYAPLNMTPRQQKDRTLAALVDQLVGLAVRQPVFFVLEDAHWVDPTTQELIELTVNRTQDLPVLVVVTFRPEFAPSWGSHTHVTSLTLNRLSRRQCATMVEKVTSGKTLPAEVVDQIVAKTDGVPLFVEELTKTVLDSGLLQEDADRYVLTGPLPRLAIPTSLQDSLMARLDRLASIKAVAQMAAALGRTFRHKLLAAVSPLGEHELQDALAQLVEAGLIYRHGIAPDVIYEFKHALVQNAAYESLLKSTRQQYHRQIAQALETHFPATVESEPELLAHHYTESGDIEQAVSYWERAGKRAFERSANLEAERHLQKGLALIETLPESRQRMEQEIQLQTAMGVTMMAAKGWGAPEVLEAYSKARGLCEQLGDSRQLFIVLRGQGQYHMISGAVRTAHDLGQRCVQLAESSGDPAFLIEAHHLLWSNNFFMGDYRSANMHADEGIARYDPDEHHPLTYIYSGHDPGVCCRCFSALMLWLHGYPDQALVRCREALRLAEREMHPLTVALAQWAFSYLHLFRREAREAQEWAEKEIAICGQYMLPLLLSQGTFQLGWALSEQGQGEQATAQMRDGMAAIKATGAEMGLPYLLAVYGEACGKAGQVSEGLSALEDALTTAKRTGAAFQIPEILRLKGELLLKRDAADITTAEKCFRQAIDAAQHQRARSLELRAATTLARLWCEQSRRTQARDLLSPVYNGFTEGFDTPDLQDARALLEGVS